MNTNRKIIIVCLAAIVAISIVLVIRGVNGETNANSTEVVKNEISVPDAMDGMASGADASGSAVGADVEDAERGREKNRDETDKETNKKKDGDGSEAGTGTKKNPADKNNDSDPESSSKDGKKAEAESQKGAKKKSAGNSAASAKPGDKSSGEPKQGEDSQKAENAPESTEIPPADEEKNECSLTVTCSEVFSHMDKLSESAERVIPANGIILQGNYEIIQGETAFDLLKRACAEKNILLDYVFTPLYSSYYIRGINNLYEFDCGDESGWMYLVNGSDTGCGCNQYKVSKGDKVVFNYTCEY